MATKTDQELVKLLEETRARLRVERFAAVGARAKDSNAPKKLRAVIARALTEQSRRPGSASRLKTSGHARSLRSGQVRLASTAVSASPGSRRPTT